MRTTKRAFGLGWRALLAPVGGLAALAGCGGPEAVSYGAVDAASCITDNDCAAGWVCDHSDAQCVYSEADAGERLDAGTK